MRFLTFDTKTGTEYQNQQYKTEKERQHLLDQARNDMRNSPGSRLWWVDIRDDEITAGPVSS